MDNLTSGIFNSSVKEVGELRNIGVRSFTGTVNFQKACGLKLGPNVPKLITAVDTAPDPIAGSQVQSTLVLDGGDAGDCLYYADGTSWNRIATLSN